MPALNEAFIYIIQTLGQLYLLVALLRFILQLVRADFYNPLSQFTVKATQPVLAPLRRIIPSVGRIDLAGLVLVLLVQFIVIVSILAVAQKPVMHLLPLILIWTPILVASLLLKIFFFALIISIILSWVAPGSNNPGAMLTQQICEPVLAPIRNLLPDLGGIDISPIFAFIIINLLQRFVIGGLVASSGLNSFTPLIGPLL